MAYNNKVGGRLRDYVIAAIGLSVVSDGRKEFLSLT